jgi:hypothetical protein
VVNKLLSRKCATTKELLWLRDTERKVVVMSCEERRKWKIQIHAKKNSNEFSKKNLNFIRKVVENFYKEKQLKIFAKFKLDDG